ncbi:MAG: helix-turn-helix transcriptional regulator, partial [Holophagales bacterium]|nr:helix-turn-helix transcriptional regulator [Holophagales bacterium]
MRTRSAIGTPASAGFEITRICFSLNLDLPTLDLFVDGENPLMIVVQNSVAESASVHNLKNLPGLPLSPIARTVEKSVILRVRMKIMPTPLEELLPLLARLVENDGELKSLADLAALDGRSPFHLQRVFRAAVGESPLQFSRRVRLQRAAASLLVTNKSVLEVALDAGFDSPDSFSRAFRAKFGMAPRRFREQRRVL